jgi:hypothetical protein
MNFSRNTRPFVARNNSRLNRLERRRDEFLAALLFVLGLLRRGLSTMVGDPRAPSRVFKLRSRRQGRAAQIERSSPGGAGPARRVAFNRICLASLQRRGQDLAKRCSNSPPAAPGCPIGELRSRKADHQSSRLPCCFDRGDLPRRRRPSQQPALTDRGAGSASSGIMKRRLKKMGRAYISRPRPREAGDTKPPPAAGRKKRSGRAGKSGVGQNLTRRPAVGAMFWVAWKPFARPP